MMNDFVVFQRTADGSLNDNAMFLPVLLWADKDHYVSAREVAAAFPRGISCAVADRVNVLSASDSSSLEPHINSVVSDAETLGDCGNSNAGLVEGNRFLWGSASVLLPAVTAWNSGGAKPVDNRGLADTELVCDLVRSKSGFVRGNNFAGLDVRLSHDTWSIS